MSLRIVLACLLLAAPASAFAQDNHFNTNAFGSRSSLYGGAVVGGARDTSAAYYNPGGLAFVDNDNLSVNASIYRLGRITLKDGAGTGEPLDAIPVELFPGIVSGAVLFDGLPGHVFAYSLITRYSFDLSTTARLEDIKNVIDDAREPGAEDFIGQLNLSSSLSEFWGGATWAWRAGPECGVGLTTFLALRSQDQGVIASSRAVGTLTGTLHSTGWNIDADYLDVRLFWRLGVSFGIGPTRIGFAATTPSINIYGRGTVFGDVTVQDIDINADGTGESFTANDRQDGLRAVFHSPGSLSFGIEHRLETWTFAFTTDLMIRQGPFTVMRPKPADFIRPAGSASPDIVTEALRVTYATGTVLNVALALEHVFAPWISGVFSFRTDFSGQVPKEAEDESIRLGLSPWNLYHFTVGAILNDRGDDGKLKEEMSIGFTYSIGRGRGDQVMNFADAAESNFLFGVTGEASSYYDMVGLLIGYTRYF